MLSNNLPRFEFNYNNGKLKAYSDWGSYPLYYLDASCSVLCPDCANEAEQAFTQAEAVDPGNNEFLASGLPVDAGVNYESEVYCDECNVCIESAY